MAVEVVEAMEAAVMVTAAVEVVEAMEAAVMVTAAVMTRWFR